MTWIQTHSGVMFSLTEPKAADVSIGDITHALSNLCRFVGHSTVFYSVAEHSVRCAQQMEAMAKRDKWTRFKTRQAILATLLHDAAEAYIGDISRPLKTLLPQIKAIESRIQRAVFAKLATVELLDNVEIMDAVRHIDYRMLFTEKRDILQVPDIEWEAPIEPFGNVFTESAWSPRHAYGAFMTAWGKCQ